MLKTPCGTRATESWCITLSSGRRARFSRNWGQHMFLRAVATLAIAFSWPLSAAGTAVDIDRFLYGASVYPELQTREEWNRMLDEFQKARFTVVRVSESSW